jgi:glucosamine--fructose-6-phosphate aminotransferase (isomerizing)
MNKFLDEIMEQPAALRDTLAFYESGTGKDLLQTAVRLYRDQKISGIFLTGMGSSYFSSYLASCLLNDCNFQASVINASELLHYHRSLLKKGTLLVSVSQSGESFETVEVLKGIPQEVPCLSVTNEASSSLAKLGTAVLLSKAGTEEMTSTKSYLCIALVKLIWCWSLAGKWTGRVKDRVHGLIDAIEELLGSRPQWISGISDFFGAYDYIELIGRGPSYATVLQGSLMFREAVRIPAGGSLGGEFRHGPMEMVGEGFRAVVFAPEGRTLEQSLKMARDMAGFGGRVLIITNIEMDLSDPNLRVFHLGVRDEYLFAVGSVIPLQIMVNTRAIELGRAPGVFTRGAKITRTE